MFADVFCEYPLNRCRVSSSGWVSFCCFMRPDPLKPEADAYLGNLLEQSFDEIWFGDAASQIREATMEGRLHTKCRCPGCPYMAMSQPYPLKKGVVYNEYPNFLEVDLPNTHCNIGGLNPDPQKSPACVMCERSAPHFKPEKNHLFEVLEKIKHVVPNLYQIHIQGIAEPFYQTRQDGYLLFDVLDTLGFDDFSNKITLSVTTNGTLFKKSVREQYLRRAPHSITNFSIDAASAETFRGIRILDCFDKVLENLYAFSEERTRNRQFLRIHNNINLMNIHEVKGMVQIAHKANVEYVEFNPTNGFNHKILVNQGNCGRFAKAQEEIIAECKRLSVPYNFIRPLDLGMTEQLFQITL